MGESHSGSLCSALSCIWVVFLSLGDLNKMRGSQKEKTLLQSLLESVRALRRDWPTRGRATFQATTHARLEVQRHLFNCHWHQELQSVGVEIRKCGTTVLSLPNFYSSDSPVYGCEMLSTLPWGEYTSLPYWHQAGPYDFFSPVECWWKWHICHIQAEVLGAIACFTSCMLCLWRAGLTGAVLQLTSRNVGL